MAPRPAQGFTSALDDLRYETANVVVPGALAAVLGAASSLVAAIERIQRSIVQSVASWPPVKGVGDSASSVIVRSLRSVFTPSLASGLVTVTVPVETTAFAVRRTEPQR